MHLIKTIIQNTQSGCRGWLECEERGRGRAQRILRTVKILCMTQQRWMHVTRKSESVSHSVMHSSFVTPWTVAHQAPLSMEFSRQEYWVGQHSLLQGIFLPDPGIKHRSPALQADSLLSEPPGKASCHYMFLQTHRTQDNKKHSTSEL